MVFGEWIIVIYLPIELCLKMASFLKFMWFLSFIVFQQLEIDYVIGESHKELLPNSAGPAAIIRIFGVTKEGLCNSLCFLHS